MGPSTAQERATAAAAAYRSNSQQAMSVLLLSPDTALVLLLCLSSCHGMPATVLEPVKSTLATVYTDMSCYCYCNSLILMHFITFVTASVGQGIH